MAFINAAADADPPDWHLDDEVRNLAHIADEPNFAEGIAASFEKREPVFGER